MITSHILGLLFRITDDRRYTQAAFKVGAFVAGLLACVTTAAVPMVISAFRKVARIVSAFDACDIFSGMAVVTHEDDVLEQSQLGQFRKDQAHAVVSDRYHFGI